MTLDDLVRIISEFRGILQNDRIVSDGIVAHKM